MEKHFNSAEISGGEAVRNVQEKPPVRGLWGQGWAVGTQGCQWGQRRFRTLSHVPGFSWGATLAPAIIEAAFPFLLLLSRG